MRKLFVIILLTLVLTPAWGQYERQVRKIDFQDYYRNANYDEALVPEYELPDPLLCLDGTRVETVEQWEQHRRPELMSLLETYMYGRAPLPDATFRWEVVRTDPTFRGGKATRRDVILHLTAEGPAVPLCIVVPNEGKSGSRRRDERRPAFLALSFHENDSIWQSERAMQSWCPDTLLAHGYGLVTFHYTDAELDKASDQFRRSALHKHYYQAGQSYPLPDEWGAVACWAWTLSRAMDYLETDDLVDARRIALLGHSRLGKAVLWAGAIDQRYRVVIPVNSGCCGAALSRRCVGETVECVNEFNPQWFCQNFLQFSHRESLLPFDQHEVIAMIAPRPVYIASAEDDNWADQRGEFLAAKAAEPVYALYGLSGIMTAGATASPGSVSGGTASVSDLQVVTDLPAVDTPASAGAIAYHIRRGPHAVLPYDWQQFIRFADRFLK